MKKIIFIAVILLVFTVCVIPVTASNAAGEAAEIVNGIIEWNLEHSKCTSLQEWIDGELSGGAGVSSEWYILALSQSGSYDFSSYEAALAGYLKSETNSKASDRLKYALIMCCAIGRDDHYISDALDGSIGEQGIMSWIYGLHIMNNGYDSREYTVSDVTAALLSRMHDDGGWSLSGEYGDVDVTAMTVQALAPYYDSDSDVKAAVDGALLFLSSHQEDDGGFASYGVKNPESASQVLVALSSLGIDCTADARFIKNGNTVIDGITKYRLTDGSFCHTEDGEYSGTATVQAFYAMIAYIRMTEGKSPLYIFDPGTSEQPTAPAETGAETSRGDNVPDQDTDGSVPTSSYKPWAALIIVCVGGAVCLLMFISGKRNIKNYIAIALITGLAILIVTVTDLSSADDYYYGETAGKENPVGTVTLTIRCDTVAGITESEYIPKDGVILGVTEFTLSEGESVYDILTQAARMYSIQVETNGTRDTVYVEGIGYLYEYDFGDLSGWVYHVNGAAASVGCGEYKLSDGDAIEWLYTCDLGEDVK